MLAIGMGPKKKPMGESPEGEESMKDTGDDFGEFSDAAFSALQSGDKEAFQEALRGAIEACNSEY